MRVLKFGGTSVANAARFKDVAGIALDEAKDERVALVISAPAKVTNLLVALVGAAVSGTGGQEEMQKIRDIVYPICEGLSRDFPKFDRKKAELEIGTTLDLIQRRIDGVKLLGECPETVQAFVESRGETFSIAIMAELLKAMGRKVRVIDPAAVLLAEGGILESSVNIDASKKRYEALGDDDPQSVLLMAGFAGGDASGRTVLLGRNGSDYSAACLAAITRASCCEIWTDVDGVYSCDPRIVPDAVLLKRMSYEEAMELSYFGAKVLHPRTIAPIARYHIPCLVYAPGLIQPGRTDRLVSQMDLGPTLLGMAGLSYRTSWLGRDLFQTDPAVDRAFISTYQGLGLVQDDQLIVLTPDQQADARHIDDWQTSQYSEESVPPVLNQQALAWYEQASDLYQRGLLHNR